MISSLPSVWLLPASSDQDIVAEFVGVGGQAGVEGHGREKVEGGGTVGVGAGDAVEPSTAVVEQSVGGMSGVLRVTGVLAIGAGQALASPRDERFHQQQFGLVGPPPVQRSGRCGPWSGPGDLPQEPSALRQAEVRLGGDFLP